MNNNISPLKGLERTAPSGLDALAFLQYTRTLCLPLTTFLILWLRNKGKKFVLSLYTGHTTDYPTGNFTCVLAFEVDQKFEYLLDIYILALHDSHQFRFKLKVLQLQFSHSGKATESAQPEPRKKLGACTSYHVDPSYIARQ